MMQSNKKDLVELARGTVIAVDGVTASGKGTIAKALAEHFSLPYLDTGLLYRAVGYQTVHNNGDPDNPSDSLIGCQFKPALLNSEILRSEKVAGYASRVSRHKSVREFLLRHQRQFAQNEEGSVIDGRDIGTVVVPNAEVKLFIIASLEERAKRRWLEMKDRSIETSLADITAYIETRDTRDENRAISPSVAAPDAFILDTTSLAKSETIEMAINIVVQKMMPDP